MQLLKSKKGVDLPLSLIITLIVLLLIFVIMVTFTNLFTQEIDRTSNIQAIKSWAMKESLLLKKSGELSTVFATQSVPPVSPLSEPIQINSRNQLFDSQSKDYAPKLIADAMVDCWSAFGNGKLDFLPSGEDSAFCYPCTAIKISDAVKEEAKRTGKTTLSNFNIYLSSTRPLGGNSKTYWEMLGGGSSDISNLEKQFEINLMEDQFIFFGARKGGASWGDVLTTYSMIGAGAGVITGAIIAVAFTGGLAIPVTAGVGVGLSILGTGAKIKWDTKNEMYPMLLVGPPHLINAYCNIKTKGELDAAQSTEEASKKIEEKQIDLLREISLKIAQCHNKEISKTIKPGETYYCDTIEMNLPDNYWIAFDSTKTTSKVNLTNLILIKGDSIIDNPIALNNFKIQYFKSMGTTVDPFVKGILFGSLPTGEGFNYMNYYLTHQKILNIYICNPDAICLTQFERDLIRKTETTPQDLPIESPESFASSSSGYMHP